MKGLSGMVAHLSMPGWWAACIGELLWGCAAVASAWCMLLRLNSCPLIRLTSSSARARLLSACCSALLAQEKRKHKLQFTFRAVLRQNGPGYQAN